MKMELAALSPLRALYYPTITFSARAANANSPFNPSLIPPSNPPNNSHKRRKIFTVLHRVCQFSR